MKFILIVFFSSLTLVSTSFSQSNDSIPTNDDSEIRKNALFLEYAGNAPSMSVNFERMIHHQNPFSIFGRIGFGVDVVNLNEGNLFVPSVPLEITATFGKHKHFLELGMGATTFLSKMPMWSSTMYDDNTNIDSLDYELYFLFVPRIGYRFESKKGWLFRAAYTPILYNSSILEDNYQTNFGISFGKKF